MTELVDLARDLVRIPSHEDESAAGDAIETWLRAETAADVARDDAGNVIARRPPASGIESEASLALVGHHDVVPPDETQVVGDTVAGATEYVVEERDGRLYGRGAADMKGAVAAMMLAFRDADPACELVFASFVGEEVGGVGARHAIEQGFAPDYAIVAEGSAGYETPGAVDVVVAHKGRRGSSIVAKGSAAHASVPETGVNAVYRACDAVDIVRDLPAPSSTVLGFDVTGSLSVTGIDGGSAWNVVPERCAITVDERTVPRDRADLARVEEIDGVSWVVDQDLPPMACDDPAFADHVLDVATAVQDETPAHAVKPHATDAGWLAQAGVTCVVCGPSETGEAHTATESVSIDILSRCQDIFVNAADSPIPSSPDPR